MRHISGWSPRGTFSPNLLIRNTRVSLNNLCSPLVVWGGVPCQKACPGMLNTNSPLSCGGGQSDCSIWELIKTGSGPILPSAFTSDVHHIHFCIHEWMRKRRKSGCRITDNKASGHHIHCHRFPPGFGSFNYFTRVL